VCLAPDTKEACPTHTTSPLNSTSMQQCACVPGFQCTYSKRLVARLVLNVSAAYLAAHPELLPQLQQAVAIACGVNVANVVVQPISTVRGLLHHQSAVHFVVEGVDSMRRAISLHHTSPLQILDVQVRPTHFIYRRRNVLGMPPAA
jgi:hypothetical protein